MKKTVLAFTIILFSLTEVRAQDTTSQKKVIDPSNPTNLYTQVNTGFEYQTSKRENIFGLRVNVQKAFNPDNLMLLELPLLYNDQTRKVGIGDMRIRYYYVAKKGITKKFIALVPFVDISVPVGSYKNGLGSGSWSLAGGVVGGFVLSKKLSLFPGISYIHITPGENKYASDGIGLQFNTSYKFNKRTFVFINPTPSFLCTNGNWKTFWSGELNLNRIIKPNKLKMNIGWGPNFTSNVHTIKMGATFYL